MNSTFINNANIAIYLYFSIVLPKVHNITLEPRNDITESSSNFAINCFLIANSSSEVEFLFRPIHNNISKSLNVSRSTNIYKFGYIATLIREAARESTGEYICQVSSDVVQASINVTIICMNFYNINNCFLLSCTYLFQ